MFEKIVKNKIVPLSSVEIKKDHIEKKAVKKNNTDHEGGGSSELKVNNLDYSSLNLKKFKLVPSTVGTSETALEIENKKPLAVGSTEFANKKAQGRILIFKKNNMKVAG
jgi:hypothetical protein